MASQDAAEIVAGSAPTNHNRLQWRILIGFLLGLAGGLAAHAFAPGAAWLDVVITYVTGPAGQIDYVAANEFLNAFAKSRAGGKTRVVALNWGIWTGVGMAAEALADRNGAPPAPASPAHRRRCA